MRALLCSALICGCAHRAKKFDAPDASALQAKQQEAQRHVRTARAEVTRASHATKKAKESHSAAVTSHNKETAEIAGIQTKLGAPEFQTVPPELRVLFSAVKFDVEVLKMTNASTAKALANVTPSLEMAEMAHANANASLDSAVNVQGEIETKYGPEYLAKVEEQTAALNIAEAAWEKNSKEIVKLRTKSIAGRIMMVVGAVAVAGLLFLWFTGKIAMGAVRVMV